MSSRGEMMMCLGARALIFRPVESSLRLATLRNSFYPFQPPMNAPLPPNEKERLAALRRYAILDTPEEPAFDRITRLVATLLKVPMATVTLIDEQRQWFKSAYGMDARQTSREVSFCAHAILHEELMVVPDAATDQRFSNNPLVTGDPRIRFYAGVPLQSP